MKTCINGKFFEMTEEEINQQEESCRKALPQVKRYELADLKKKLANSDYKAIKYSEGYFTEEEYAPIKAERQAIRDAINALEIEIAELESEED